MKDRVGMEFEAVITGMNKSNMFATLLQYPITGVIKLSSIPGDYYTFDEQKMFMNGKRRKGVFKLAQKINIRVAAVTDDIYYEVMMDKNKK